LCQHVVEDLATLLPRFLQINTLPIICYQESEQDVERALAKMNKSPFSPVLWRIHVGEKEFNDFQLQNWGMGAILKHVPLLMYAMTLEQKSMVLPVNSSSLNTRIEIALFIVEKQNVVKCSLFNDKVKRFVTICDSIF
jgi:hypothetical protein